MKNIFIYVFVFISSLLLYSCGGSSENNSDKNDESAKEVVIEITEETANINGVNHFILKMGKGEPLVVLHGGPGLFHNYLAPHFKKLAANYQIIFYDQRGSGKTAFPIDTTTISMNNYIEDVEGIRKHLKLDKLNLIGHSWGAILAVNYGKKYPSHLSRLILVSPEPTTSEFFNQKFNNMQAKRNDEDTKVLIEAMMTKEYEKSVHLEDKVNLIDQEKIAELYEPMNFDKTNAHNFLLIKSMMERNFFNYNLVDSIDVINCPALVIIGDLDNVPFASNQLLVESIKGAQLEIIKKSCHYPFFERPREFNRVINNFLNPEYTN